VPSPLILVVSLALALVPVYVSALKQRPDLLGAASIFAFGYTASYGFKAALINHRPDLYVTYPEKFAAYADFDYRFVIFWPWLGLIMFYLGYLTAPGWGRYLFPSVHLSRVSIRVVRAVFLIFVLFGLTSVLLLLFLIRGQLAGISLSVAGIGQLRNLLMESWERYPGFFHFPVYTGFFGLAALHLSYMIAKDRSNGRRPSKALFALILLSSMATLLIVGSRALLLSFVLSLLFYRHHFVKRIRFASQLTVLGFLVLAGGYLGIIQKSGEPEGLNARALDFPWNVIYRLAGSYEQYETLLYTIGIDPPKEFGRTIFEDVFVTYFPRRIWPDKPREFGFIRAQNVIFNDYWQMSRVTTYPIGVLGELFLNFGYFGIVAGMFFMGWLLKLLQRRAFQHPRSLYPAAFCFVTAVFIAPHRTFGTTLLTMLLLTLCALSCSIVGDVVGTAMTPRTRGVLPKRPQEARVM
jgi:oligosaccharide repeat unit polymerase